MLISGESVLHRGRVSLWPHAWKIVLGIVLLPVLGLGLVLLAWVWIIYSTTEIAITNKRIIAKFGFISRSTIEINLPKVESVQVDQSVMGRMLDYGTVVFSGAGTPEFRKHFMEATDRLQPRPAR